MELSSLVINSGVSPFIEISTSSPGNSSVQPAVTTSSSNIPKDIVLRTLLASDDEDELPAPLSLCRPIKSDGASPSSTSTPSQNSTEPVLLKVSGFLNWQENICIYIFSVFNMLSLYVPYVKGKEMVEGTEMNAARSKRVLCLNVLLPLEYWIWCLSVLVLVCGRNVG